MTATVNAQPRSVSDFDWPAEDLERITTCPVCGSTERSLLHESLVDGIFFCADGRWRMFRCGNCGSGYLDPRPTPASISRAYASYYTHAASPAPLWRSDATMIGGRLRAGRNAYLNRRFPGLRLRPASGLGALLLYLTPFTRSVLERDVRNLPAPAPGARVLDIGCGDGNFLKIARILGYQAEGLEFDAQAVAAARGEGLDVHLGGLPDSGLQSASYDAVTLSQVIEHVHDPLASLQEAARLLRPGGMLWVATPNIDAKAHRTYGPHWRGLEPPRHLVLFSAIALRRALAEAGFRDVRLLPAGPVSQWFFEASEKIARGLDPSKPYKLALRDRLRAMWSDVQAQLHPELGEEILIMGIR